MGMRTRLSAAGALALIVVLAGCTPTPAGSTPTPSTPATSALPAATATASPTATSAPAPTGTLSGPLTMPTCDQIMDADATAQLFDPNIEPIPGVGGLEPSALPGPAAQAALASATVSVSCMWGIPNSDGGFHGVIAQLDPTTRDELIAALEASSYERGTVSGAPSYGADFDDEILGYSVHYTFEGDAWVIVMGTLFHQEDSVPVAERALAALHAVNP